MTAFNGVTGGDLTQQWRPADGQVGGVPLPVHGHGAVAAGDEVDILGVVVQFDAGGVAAGGGTLIVQGPGAAAGEAVVRQNRRVVERGVALLVASGAALVADFAHRQVGLVGEAGRGVVSAAALAGGSVSPG